MSILIKEFAINFQLDPVQFDHGYPTGQSGPITERTNAFREMATLYLGDGSVYPSLEVILALLGQHDFSSIQIADSSKVREQLGMDQQSSGYGQDDQHLYLEVWNSAQHAKLGSVSSEFVVGWLILEQLIY